MKQVINGKLYNTDTAKYLGRDDNGCGSGDFYYVREELYRKKTGEHFLYGSGGGNTEYGVSCGNNSWRGGEAIIPLTEKQAKEWAEEHLDADEYIKAFGPVAE